MDKNILIAAGGILALAGVALATRAIHRKVCERTAVNVLKQQLANMTPEEREALLAKLIGDTTVSISG